MASGQTIARYNALNNEPPASGAATIVDRNAHKALAFADASTESAVFSDVMPEHYGGGGLTVEAHFTMAMTNTGNVRLEGAFERIGTTQDKDTNGFASAQAVTVAVAGTSGVDAVATFTFNDGAEMDSIATGEEFRFKFSRVGGNAADTASGDLELGKIHITET